MAHRLKMILKAICIAILFVILVVMGAHCIGRVINSRTPDGGINQSMYADINGTKQWINIYGNNLKNPVLLYLHGGPGSSTSIIDYAVTRKWADDYIVVTWDQRNSGKSYNKNQNSSELTYELLMEDGKELTEFILDYMDRNKLTVLGHSWGSLYGANLVQAYPEYYDCFIGTGQFVDSTEDEVLFKIIAAEWAAGDEEAMKLVEQLTPEHLTESHYAAREALIEKYGYGVLRDGTDYNLVITVLFNPYYSIADWIKYLLIDRTFFSTFVASSEYQRFSIQGKYDYEMPYYNINGNEDYNTIYTLAEEYYKNVNAPDKQLFIMDSTTHGLLLSKSEWFSEYIHEIAEKQK